MEVGAEGSDVALNRLLETAKVVPYPSEQRQTGFKLEKVRAGSPWTQAGLRQGDIVVKVADQPLRTRDDLMTLFYAIGRPGAAPIEVRRHGRTLTLEAPAASAARAPASFDGAK